MTWNKPRGTKVLPENIMKMTFQKPLKLTRKKNPIKYKFLKPKTSIRNGNLKISKQTKLEKLKIALKKINKSIPLSFLIDTDDTSKFHFLIRYS